MYLDGSQQPGIEVIESTLAARSWKTSMSMQPFVDSWQSPFNPGCSAIMFRHQGPRNSEKQTTRNNACFGPIVDAKSVACWKWHAHVFFPMLSKFVCGLWCFWCVQLASWQVRAQPRRSESQDSQDPNPSTPKTSKQHGIIHIACSFVCWKSSLRSKGLDLPAKVYCKFFLMAQQDGLIIHTHIYIYIYTKTHDIC